MNTNTFKSYSSAYPSGHPFALPASSTTTSITQTAFVLSNGNQAVIQAPQGTEILGSQTQMDPNANAALTREGGRSAAWFGENRPFFNSTSFSGRAFRMRATGVIAGGGTTLTSIAATIAIYAACTQLTTVTSGTNVASLSSGAILGNTSANWYADATFLWDATSQTLNTIGNYTMKVGSASTVTTYSTLITGVTIANLAFGATYQFATSSTSNSVGMVELCLEQV